MLGSSLVPLLILCIVHGSFSKPFEDNLVEGRGIGSTLWGWITYPFTWWSSGETETPPASDQLVAPNSNPTINKEIEPHNVTMCNAQTCTTMRCGSFGCEELVTCNIYDTDLKGDCRNYNTAVPPEEPMSSNSPNTVAKPQEEIKPQDIKPQDNKPQDIRPQDIEPKDIRPQDVKPQDIRPQDVKPQNIRPQDIKLHANKDISQPQPATGSESDTQNDNQGTEERPLELEAVLSSTVTDTEKTE